MITFSFSNLHFIDSFSFCQTSIDTLVSNLYDKGAGIDNFVMLRQWLTDADLVEVLTMRKCKKDASSSSSSKAPPKTNAKANGTK